MAAAKKPDKAPDELQVSIDPALFNDARLAFIMGKLMRSASNPQETASAYAEFIEFVLGGADAAMDAMNAYAAAHGGRCDNAQFTEWLMSKVAEAGELGKN